MNVERVLARGRRVIASTDSTGRRHGWWAVGRDVLVGAAIFAALWVTAGAPDGVERMAQLALGALAVAGLLLRRRWPVVAVLVTAGATATAWVLGLTADPFLLTAFCVYACAESRGFRRFPWWLLAGAGVVVLATLGFSSEGVEGSFRGALLGAVVIAAAWMLGVRTRQARREAAARARAEERLRLARDVHDVLSHSLGTIGVRAGIAAHVSTLAEAELRGALREIEVSARVSLAELKALLHHERAGNVGCESDAVAVSLPLTAVLADIARSGRQLGLVVELDLDDGAGALPAGVRTTVHRVVQEAVTNVIRHAAASSLVIRVRTDGDNVVVSIADDGRGSGATIREGYGLTGMRERVELVGGTLSVESTATGFAVTAILGRAAPVQKTVTAW